MDYLIADPNLIYANEHEMYSEKIIYLPNIGTVIQDLSMREKNNNSNNKK